MPRLTPPAITPGRLRELAQPTLVAGDVVLRPWEPADDLWSLVFSLAFDLQVVVGLALYFFISPFSRLAFENFGAAMSNPSLRFWAVEHITGMMIAIGFEPIPSYQHELWRYQRPWNRVPMNPPTAQPARSFADARY